MTSDAPKAADWTRVEELFPDFVALPVDQRPAFLDRMCAGDAALRAELESLSAAATQNTLDAPPTMRGGEAAAATAMQTPPEQLGVWRILRLIGRGGMGEVYLAERTGADFAQLGAVKVLRPEAAAHNERFESERRILAQLEHAGIARLLDGGVAPSGRPYMVMEYVSGATLLDFCAQHSLDLAARIGLFEQIARAVAYAHAHLVVHRDLKSGNILVTAEGQPKLLDFGIAKLVETEAGSDVTHTALFTPEHAAPEQLQGAPATTAVDIYALGVMLYELLAGVRPWTRGGTSLSRVMEKLMHDEPQPASRAAGGNPAAPVAATLLRGDLDAIIGKCLRKMPQARYGTVDALLQDLQRWREHRAVLARGDARGYIARRWLRRRRIPVTAGLLLLLAVLTGTATTYWQASSALREARRAQETREFLVQLFESVDPNVTRGESVTAKELLDRGARRLESALVAEPELRAEMLTLVGRLYGELGFYKEALPLLEAGRAVSAGAAQPDNPELPRSTAALANVLLQLGEYERAEALARETVALRAHRRDELPAEYADAVAALASILDKRARNEEAEKLFHEALGVDRRVGTRAGLARHLSDYSLFLRNQTRYDEALRAGEEALALNRELHGAEHTSVATSLVHLAAIVTARGDHRRPEVLLREALSIRVKLLGETHPLVASTYLDIADNQVRNGRYDESEASARKAVAILSSTLGDDHPETASGRNHLGVALFQAGKYAQSAAVFEDVLIVWRRTHGPHHPHVYAVLNNLGAALNNAGELEAAEKVLRETLALRRETLGDSHEDVAQSLNNLGELLVKREVYPEAEASYRAAISMWRKTLGDSHPTVAYGLMSLGKLLLRLQRCEEGAPVLLESVNLREKALDANAPILASSRSYLGQCLVQLQRFAEAEPQLAQSVPILIEAWGADQAFVQNAVNALRAARAATAERNQR